MKTWTENQFDMVEENGTVYWICPNTGDKHIFVEWSVDDFDNVVPIIKIEWC